MTATAVIPMIALAGSAIDISRIYLANTRLQAACDSAVLAGRRAMTTVTYTTTAQQRANAMFAFNFDDEDYQSTGTAFSATADSVGKVDGVASTTIPMLVMDMFGYDVADLDVTCSADIQVPNIDIVFVLDVTGSMDGTIDGVKKIASLKTAAIGFYDSIAAAMVGNTRTQVRYGFVPYSQAVNGSELFVSSPDFADLGQLPLTHLQSSRTVQSRVANFNTETTGGWQVDTSTTPTVFDQRFETGNAASRSPLVAAWPTGTDISDFDCSRYGENLSFQIGSTTPVIHLFPLTSTTSESQGSSILYKPEGSSSWQTTEPTSGNSYTRATFQRVSWTGSNTMKKCVRRVTHTRYVRQTGFRFTDWTYRPVTVNVSNYRSGSDISYTSSINTSTAVVPTSGSYDMVTLAQMTDQTGLTTSTTSWNGCLEERDTTAATSFSPIPSAALDMNYLTGGTTDATRWRPMIRELTYLRTGTANQTTTNNNSKPGLGCPSASMRNLREYDTRSAFVNYINSLQPNGNTYLDVGMIWGLRLIAPQGMFADRNLVGPNGGQISRHIIFLTDGEPVDSATSYSAYGTEQVERRITGSTGVAASTLHARRFQAMCDAERGRVSIWAVAFGTSVTGNLQNCADSGRAMQANSTTELNNAFARIANEVADLRLVQ